MPESDFDMFNDQAIKEVLQRINKLEKDKTKTELERDILKQQMDRLMKAHDQIRAVLIEQEETMNKMRNEA
ncbi:hypothetical protein Hanom_Chr10g00914241 [Helianthus anomalus]